MADFVVAHTKEAGRLGLIEADLHPSTRIYMRVQELYGLAIRPEDTLHLFPPPASADAKTMKRWKEMLAHLGLAFQRGGQSVK